MKRSSQMKYKWSQGPLHGLTFQLFEYNTDNKEKSQQNSPYIAYSNMPC